jgi:hypothetical protein
MNFKTLLTALLGFCLIMNIEAKPVNLSEAEKVAKNFLYITLNKYDNGISYEQLRLSDPYTYMAIHLKENLFSKMLLHLIRDSFLIMPNRYCLFVQTRWNLPRNF